MKALELQFAGTWHRLRFDGAELRFQIVQEQRVDDLVNVFDGGVVHSALAPGLRVQGGFKYRAENGGADFRPVKVLGGVTDQQIEDFLRNDGNFDVFIAEQAAVYIGKRGQGGVVLRQIRVALRHGLIQDAEQVDQRFPGVPDAVGFQVIMKGPPLEQAAVLRVQAENATDAQGVQAVEGRFTFGVMVLLEQRVVQLAHQIPGFDGNFHFPLQVFIAGVHQEIQPGVFLFQVA